MNQRPLQATIMDVVPLGTWLLLSVRGLDRRPALPASGVVVQTGERLRLLGQPDSPTMWLLSEVTLLAEPQGEVEWRRWKGQILAISEAEDL